MKWKPTFAPGTLIVSKYLVLHRAAESEMCERGIEWVKLEDGREWTTEAEAEFLRQMLP